MRVVKKYNILQFDTEKCLELTLKNNTKTDVFGKEKTLKMDGDKAQKRIQQQFVLYHFEISEIQN